jgi:molybdenum cofactor guanylyltransferase
VTTAPAVAILAGGASRRMGRDKALLPLDGETLLHRTARLALELGPTVAVIGRTEPAGWNLPVRWIPDHRPGDGPLTAIATALAELRAPVLALPCDLPRLTLAALAWIAAAPRGEFGVAATLGGQAEPLFAVWLPAAQPAIDAALASGRRSCQAILADPSFARIAAPDELAPALADCDDPAEWDRLGGPT